jgi:DNA invertase Pin-like site-specific DNA recombinase
MNRDQKKYVLELYQQGMTVRYCATTLDMSFTEIGRIIKEVGISFENTEL